MKIGVITLFPEMFNALECGISGKAIKNSLIEIFYWNPRDYTENKHGCVDDRPYGGGPGMVMMVQPIIDAIKAAKKQLGGQSKVVYLSPQGETINQQKLNTQAIEENNLILLAGRYEGIDERIIDLIIDEQWSIGDIVLSGGELAAMTIIDGLIRLIPGALGNDMSAKQDSFMNGLLDYPHYTRPEEIYGKKVPTVLLNGNHKEIEKWRRAQALENTNAKRPDLINNNIYAK